jgi:MFS family permease
MLSRFRNKKIPDVYLYVSHFLDHFIILVFAKAAYDAGQEIGLSYGETIQLATLGFILFGVASPIAARLADIFSRSIIMVVFHFGIGISSILISFSYTSFHLVLGLSSLGFFSAIFHPVGIAMLLETKERVGLRLGINGLFGNMGVASAPLITGVIIFYSNWKMAFFVSGILCIVYGIFFSMALKPTVDQSGELLTKIKSEKFSPGWKQALVALGISTTFGGFIFTAVTFLVPRYLELYMKDLLLSVAMTGLLASLVYATSSFSQVIVGWLIDRMSPRIVLFIVSIGQIIFIYLASQFDGYNLVFFMTLAVCFVFGQIPIIDAVMVRYIPDSWRNRVLSMKFVLNLGVGATVLPTCSFMLDKGYKLSDLFSFLCLFSVIIVFASILLPSQSSTINGKKIHK